MKNKAFNFSKLSLLCLFFLISLFLSCDKNEALNFDLAADQSVESRTSIVSDYDLITDQEKADLARFLGWLWADGKPLSNDNGARYTGGQEKYEILVGRLADISINGDVNPFNFPTSGNLKKLPDFWDYWNNAIPGGNEGDPQVLRDAMQNPNFLAGLIEGEGYQQHTESEEYYIDDQTYFPSHPTKTRYSSLYFGPERMNQLFFLLGETYGFSSTQLKVGQEYYDYETQACEGADALRARHQLSKAINEDPNTGPDAFNVKVIIDPSDWATLRSYGYFPVSNYRTPEPDSDGLNQLTGDFPDVLTEVDGTMTFFDPSTGGGLLIKNTNTQEYLSSDLDMVPFTEGNSIAWELVEITGVYYRIVSLDETKTKKWLRAGVEGTLNMASESSTGGKTRWEKIELANDSYLLKNKKYGTYLRVGGSGNLKHGASGTPAHWTIEESAGCAPQ